MDKWQIDKLHDILSQIAEETGKNGEVLELREITEYLTYTAITLTFWLPKSKEPKKKVDVET